MIKASGTSERRRARAKQENAVGLSEEAAVRVFTQLSDEAARLLWAMVRVIASTGTTCGCVGDAIATTRMSIDEAVRGLEELRHTGLMQRTPRGTDRLHPLFGSIGHRLSEYSGLRHENTSSGELIVLSPRVSS